MQSCLHKCINFSQEIYCSMVCVKVSQFLIFTAINCHGYFSRLFSHTETQMGNGHYITCDINLYLNIQTASYICLEICRQYYKSLFIDCLVQKPFTVMKVMKSNFLANPYIYNLCKLYSKESCSKISIVTVSFSKCYA